MIDLLISAAGTIVIAALLWMAIIFISRKLRENESLKYEFITIIAHKFRTPLTQIKWTADNLSGEEADQYKKESLETIRKANENLIKLTNTLIEMTDASSSAKSSYNLERLDLCALAKESLDGAKEEFHEKNLFMSLSSAEPSVFVNADRSRLGFVIGTMLENACAYTPPGRNISITIGVKRRRAVLSVVDDGIGIDSKDIQHMFVKFFRTKEAQAMDTEGLGVGLYLAKSIVKRLKGKMVAFSEGLGKGSTFSVVLPRVK